MSVRETTINQRTRGARPYHHEVHISISPVKSVELHQFAGAGGEIIALLKLVAKLPLMSAGPAFHLCFIMDSSPLLSMDGFSLLFYSIPSKTC